MLHDKWVCSQSCFDEVLGELLTTLVPNTRPNRDSKAHRFPLGLLMHSLGLVSKESLQSALQAQREAGEGRVGDWLRRRGVVTEPQITQALAMQWSLPVYPLDKWESIMNWARLLPLALLDSFGMLPVHCTSEGGLLYVAFSNRVDYSALYAIEQMLDLRTQACVAQESYVKRVLERLHQQGLSQDMPIEGPMEPSIISNATRQEAMKLGAREVRVVGCADNIWIRLHASETMRDLLFHRAAQEPLLTPVVLAPSG